MRGDCVDLVVVVVGGGAACRGSEGRGAVVVG